VDLLQMRYSDQLDERGQDCIKRIGEGLDRMSALVDAVLAHAQAGQKPVASSQSTSAEEALYTALENLRSDIIGSQAEIVHGSLPDLLIASEPLCRVFQNLVSNAIKYRKPDVAPRIEITAERQHASWRIGVCDNGIGIEPQYFERIFIPMQRLHGPEIAGSGIGLATCKKIVGRAGGRIWVESEPGKGSCFYFALPGE
jgi:light-regulated signal transduction histidine kinase (bacteriophytochrome)